ncbi:MAG TPA: ankyrin repeat domain-containing protein [Pyrinomonadaceae bacterium]|jgi:ankyrin repeat protein
MRYTLVSIILVLLVGAACRTGQTTRSPEADALLRAARAGHADVVKTLLSAPNADVNAKDEHGNTALMEAARFGHDDVVKALLIARADVRPKNDEGKTALMLAVEGGHDDSVRLLRQAGATE